MTARHYVSDLDRRRKRIGTLARRRDFLRSLLKKDEGNSWDAAEETALTWAIDLLDALFPEDTDTSKEEPA
jgi:hypothetical protein